MAERRASLEERVVGVAEAALAERSVVSPIDVLVGLGWLRPQAVDVWRQGRADDLERLAQANLHKLSAAMAVLRRWAAERGLRPSETAYVARTRDRRPLRFSRSGDASVEAAYRTHWISPELSEAKQRRLTERQSAAPDLVVVSALGDWSCTACGQTGDLLMMEGPGPLCLGCADLDHLVFLAAGDAALTRRATKASGLSAVVIRFSRSRRRYQRQGTLVEEEALVQAEQACLADEDARQRRRLREEARSSEHDAGFQAAFADAIVECSPDARPSGPNPSPATPEPATAVASGAAPPGAPSTPTPSPSPWPPPFATLTLPMTGCSCQASPGPTPAARSPTRSATSSIPGDSPGCGETRQRRAVPNTTTRGFRSNSHLRIARPPAVARGFSAAAPAALWAPTALGAGQRDVWPDRARPTHGRRGFGAPQAAPVKGGGMPPVHMVSGVSDARRCGG